MAFKMKNNPIKLSTTQSAKSSPFVVKSPIKDNGDGGVTDWIVGQFRKGAKTVTDVVKKGIQTVEESEVYKKGIQELEHHKKYGVDAGKYFKGLDLNPYVKGTTMSFEGYRAYPIETKDGIRYEIKDKHGEVDRTRTYLANNYMESGWTKTAENVWKHPGEYLGAGGIRRVFKEAYKRFGH